MKITIPIPCKEKLTNDNYCTKCQHQIIDFSKLTNNEILEEFQKNKVHCGIFHPKQLDQNLIKKTISNVMIISAIGLFTSCSDGQNKKVFEIKPTPINDSIEKETKQFQLRVTNAILGEKIKTYRLLINDEIVKNNLEVDKDYTIKFDLQKDTNIYLRLASNETILELTKDYTIDNFPTKINFSSNDFTEQETIMGEIAFDENFAP